MPDVKARHPWQPILDPKHHEDIDVEIVLGSWMNGGLRWGLG